MKRIENLHTEKAKEEVTKNFSAYWEKVRERNQHLYQFAAEEQQKLVEKAPWRTKLRMKSRVTSKEIRSCRDREQGSNSEEVTKG